MNSFQEYLRRAVFTVTLFFTEALIQITLFSLSIFLTDKYHDDVGADFWITFLDTFKIIFVLKLIFFLPSYLFVYITKANLSANVVVTHLSLHTMSLVIISILFTPFVFTGQGLLMVGLGTLIAYLTISGAKATFRL